MVRRLLLCVAILALAVPSTARELAGVTMPESVTVDGTKLDLNGMGLRKKAIFKVYVGALYVVQRSTDPAALARVDAPRRQVMHFLRNVDRDKIVEAWQEGFANNSPATAAALKDRLAKFSALWLDMKDGQEAVMTYTPGTGLKFEIAGKELGVIPGKDFADAVLATWVGPKPPSEDLKNGVLGK